MRTFLLLLLLSASVILRAQPKATFGSDIAVPASAGLQYGHAKVAISPTGVIYVARMRSGGSGIGSRWEIVRSTDAGKTFASWKEGLPLANGHYTAMDFRGVTHSGGIFGLYLAIADVFTEVTIDVLGQHSGAPFEKPALKTV